MSEHQALTRKQYAATMCQSWGDEFTRETLAELEAATDEVRCLVAQRIGQILNLLKEPALHETARDCYEQEKNLLVLWLAKNE